MRKGLRGINTISVHCTTEDVNYNFKHLLKQDSDAFKLFMCKDKWMCPHTFYFYGDVILQWEEYSFFLSFKSKQASATTDRIG